MGDRKLILTPEAEAFVEEWESESPFLRAHTSGSTGKPKEISLLKEDMRSSALATLKFFGINETSTLALPLSPDYIAGKMQIVRAIEAECSLIVEPPSSRPFREWKGGRITLLPIVPSQLDGLTESAAFSLADNIIIGGAPLRPEQEDRLIEAGVKAWVTYGMTETCSHVALRRVGEECFVALPGFSFSTDQRGCLVIESTTLSAGLFVTNDMVSIQSPHSFRWLGRYDNVINSGGVKIHPEEIEKVMAPLLPAGTTAYVTSRRSERWGEEAVIVTDSPAVDDGFLEIIRPLLSPRHCPKAVIHVPEIGRTPSSGKIVRLKL